MFLVLGSWFAQFAHSRITRQPSPRPKYWKARIALLDPPGEGAVSIVEAEYILKLNPRTPRVGLYERDMEATIFSGAWEDDRPDVIAATQRFTSEEYLQPRIALRRALQAGWAEPPPTYPGGEGTLEDQHWRWALALIAHSRWSREQTVGMTTSVEDWLMALRLGRQLRRPRTAPHLGASSSISRKVAREMMHTAKEPHSVVDTRSLADDIEVILGPLLRPSELLEGQRLYMHMLLENMYVRHNGDWLVVSEVSPTFPHSRWDDPPSAPRIWNLAAPLFHDLPTARRGVDEYFAALDGLTDLVECAKTRTDDERYWVRLRPGALDGLQIYGAGNYRGGVIAMKIASHYEARCSLGAAVTMLALYEYDRKHGHYPDNLEETVPDYLPRLPIDYADHAPLRYRREDDGYLLYSIGPDGRDNGGRGPDYYGWFEDDTDAVFSRAERGKYRR